MRIVTLIENIQDDAGKLAHEHGLSLYIETADKNILFDTGETGAFVGNAEKLGVNLKAVDMAVLSHGHHDHSGGLLSFFEKNSKVPVYMKRHADRDYFFKTASVKTSVRTDSRVFSEHAERIKYVDGFSEIAKDVFVITDIKKDFAQPSGNKYLFMREEGQVKPDPFDHELILVVREPDGLNVFTGCSHNGVSNMIQAVKDHFKDEKIKSLFGGFHLMQFSRLKFWGASDAEIAAISSKLWEEDIGKIYTGHCTGEKAYRKLKNTLGNKIGYMKTGTVLQL